LEGTERTWTAADIEETVRGFRMPLLLAAVVKSGALDRLVEGSADAAALASSCGVDPGALDRVLNALTAEGLLEKEGGAFSLPPALRGELRDRGVGTGLDGVRHLVASLDKWKGLDDALLTGAADYPEAMDVTSDPALNESFIRAMHVYAAPRAQRLAELLPREGAASLLDLGGGPGTFSLALLEAWPGLVATVADLPLTLRVTRRVVEETGSGDRLSTLEADFYVDRSCDLGGPWDLVLVSNIIHAEGEVENRDLFRRIRPAVAGGGRIVVRESLLREERTGPAAAALFDVHMLACTRRGRCYTLEEVRSMLEEAGFREPQLLGEFEEGTVVARA
jgi:predicted O-methyltransferase YrrM